MHEHAENIEGHEIVRILCLHGFRQTSEGFTGRSAGLRKRLRQVARLEFIDAPHALPAIVKNTQSSSVSIEQDNALQQARPRRAWLVTPEQRAALLEGSTVGSLAFDEHQLHRQVCGWEESYAEINKVLDGKGVSYDGILGFSQGAAVAAAVAALECRRPLQGRRFRFAILCSGYVAAVPVAQEALHTWQQTGGIPIPSLHIYGENASDGQVSEDDYSQLLEAFSPRERVVLRHPGGHFIPSDKESVQQIAAFLASVDRAANDAHGT